MKITKETFPLSFELFHLLLEDGWSCWRTGTSWVLKEAHTFWCSLIVGGSAVGFCFLVSLSFLVFLFIFLGSRWICPGGKRCQDKTERQDLQSQWGLCQIFWCCHHRICAEKEISWGEWRKLKAVAGRMLPQWVPVWVPDLGVWLKELIPLFMDLISTRMMGSAFLHKQAMSLTTKSYLLKRILPSLVFLGNRPHFQNSGFRPEPVRSFVCWATIYRLWSLTFICF